MPTLSIEYEDDSERLLIEQASAMAADLKRTALEAPHAAVLAACEAEAVAKGRKLTASALEDALRRRVVEAEASPLAGMALLEGHRVTFDAVPGGPVTIETPP